MKFAGLFVLLVAVVAEATHVQENPLARRHHKLSRRSNSPEKRCRRRDVNQALASAPASSTPAPSSSSPPPSSSSWSPSSSSSAWSAPSSSTDWSAPSSSAAGWAAPWSSVWSAATSAAAPIASAVEGLINVQSNCGDIGATEIISALSGPNGAIDWLNCGLNNGGWNPPYIKVSDIITKDLGDAVKDPNSAFQACSAYIDTFENYAGQHGIPAILLASFAMQESSCKPDTVGGNGEEGLMQITQDKCANAPGGNCQDIDYNIKTGAQFFADSLNNNGGDLLLTIGGYNGWSKGLTFDQATAAGNGPSCHAQNNLDYLHQFLNGWCQNVNAYSANPPLGKYFNLNKCS